MSATDVRRLIQQIVGDMRNLPITGTVTRVEGQTCAVLIASELEMVGVRLKATVTENKQKVLLVPKVGSNVVLLSQSAGLENLFIVQCDEIERLEIITENVKIVVDQKIAIEVDGVSLSDTFTKLCDAIKTLTVSTGVGPSGTPLPSTQQKVQQLENDFQTIFK